MTYKSAVKLATIAAIALFTLAAIADTKPNKHCSEWAQSKHSKRGVGCVACHAAPGKNPAKLKKPVTKLCLGCHSKKIKNIATHAPQTPAGATCATCHMPNGDHTFAKIEK